MFKSIIAAILFTKEGEKENAINRNFGNKKLVYELIYDEKSIRNLISEIIEKCSIRKECKSEIKACGYADAEKEIASIKDFNSNKIHINVKNLNQEPLNDPYDYWRNGDPLTFSFTSDKLFSPKLVDFLINLINGHDIDYNWFTSKKELSLKLELKAEIKKLSDQINGISNFETKRKISKLEELDKRINETLDIPDFDHDLLFKYYAIAQSCIQLELIQETLQFQPKLTPKNILKMNKQISNNNCKW